MAMGPRFSPLAAIPLPNRRIAIPPRIRSRRHRTSFSMYLNRPLTPCSSKWSDHIHLMSASALRRFDYPFIHTILDVQMVRLSMRVS